MVQDCWGFSGGTWKADGGWSTVFVYKLGVSEEHTIIVKQWVESHSKSKAVKLFMGVQNHTWFRWEALELSFTSAQLPLSRPRGRVHFCCPGHARLSFWFRFFLGIITNFWSLQIDAILRYIYFLPWYLSESSTELNWTYPVDGSWSYSLKLKRHSFVDAISPHFSCRYYYRTCLGHLPIADEKTEKITKKFTRWCFSLFHSVPLTIDCIMFRVESLQNLVTCEVTINSCWRESWVCFDDVFQFVLLSVSDSLLVLASTWSPSNFFFNCEVMIGSWWWERYPSAESAPCRNVNSKNLQSGMWWIFTYR